MSNPSIISFLYTPVARIALQSNKRWLSLICLVGLLLAASACTPSDIQVNHPANRSCTRDQERKRR